MTVIKKILLITLVSFYSLAALADDKQPQRYDIEIIFFTQNDGWTDELFPNEVIEPIQDLTSLVLHQEDNLSGISQTTPESLPKGFEFFTKEDFNYPQYDYALNRKGYKSLLHLGWRQIIPDIGHNNWFWIEKQGLRGYIKISKGRFLHLDTNLLVENKAFEEHFLIKTHRKMPRSEMHHIDHPKLGILIQIDRHEETEIMSKKVKI